MKVYYYFLFSIMVVFSFTSCRDCKDCQNNLSQYLSNYFPYKNGDTIHFYNDIKGEIVDTVKISYDPPEKEYCSDGKESTMKCSGSLNMVINDFTVSITQNPNYLDNQLSFSQYFNNAELNQRGCFDCYYILIDTINYNYNSNIIKAYKYLMNDSSLILPEIDYYSSYIISDDNKLLQYTEVKDNKTYTWKAGQ